MHVKVPGGHRVSTGGLGLHGQHGAQPEHGAESSLQVRQLLHQAVHLGNEHAGGGEQGHQLGDRCPLLGDQVDAGDGDRGQDGAQQYAAAQRGKGLQLQDAGELAVYVSGKRCDCADHVCLTEAGADVVAGCDRFFHGSGVGAPRGLLRHLALGDQGQDPADAQPGRYCRDRKQDRGRPPDEASNHPEGPNTQHDVQRPEGRATQQGSDLMGVVVDAVEHLPHGLLGQFAQRLCQCGIQQVGTQPALGPVHHARPDHVGEDLHDYGTQHDRCEQRYRCGGGVFGEQPGDHEADGPACGRKEQRDTDYRCRSAAQPSPVHWGMFHEA